MVPKRAMNLNVSVHCPYSLFDKHAREMTVDPGGSCVRVDLENIGGAMEVDGLQLSSNETLMDPLVAKEISLTDLAVVGREVLKCQGRVLFGHMHPPVPF